MRYLASASCLYSAVVNAALIHIVVCEAKTTIFSEVWFRPLVISKGHTLRYWQSFIRTNTIGQEFLLLFWRHVVNEFDSKHAHLGIYTDLPWERTRRPQLAVEKVTVINRQRRGTGTNPSLTNCSWYASFKAVVTNAVLFWIQIRGRFRFRCPGLGWPLRTLRALAFKGGLLGFPRWYANYAGM